MVGAARREDTAVPTASEQCPADFTGVLVVQVTREPIEDALLRRFVPFWARKAGWGAYRIARWSELRAPGTPRTEFPNVTHVVVSGHGYASPQKSPGAYPWREAITDPPLFPSDLRAICGNAELVELWVCYQGQFREQWGEPWGETRPEIIGRDGPVLGPFGVPEKVTNAVTWLRARLRR